MTDFLKTTLRRQGIRHLAPVPLSACRITRRYLLQRAGIEDGTAVMLAVPYTVSHDRAASNLSAYAVSRDYHLFFRELFEEILPLLRDRFPTHRFAGFADHSPIDEIHAAALAGLGVIGDNGLLLTEQYSSYIFLGEIITDARLPAQQSDTPGTCHRCGACRRACPVGRDMSRCLSALTQKKGELTAKETALLRAHPLVWGCDICQEVCPYTQNARRQGTLCDAPPFFRKQSIPHLTVEMLDGMDEDTFRARAYAWRGREVIRRNLLLREGKTPDKPKGT